MKFLTWAGVCGGGEVAAKAEGRGGRVSWGRTKQADIVKQDNISGLEMSKS